MLLRKNRFFKQNRLFNRNFKLQGKKIITVIWAKPKKYNFEKKARKKRIR